MKKWLIDKFLPIWAKETVLSDNRALMEENRKLKEKIRALEAYIQGVHEGMRRVKRITINNRGGTE